ncbi:class I SAM-dependent methyltransferase [Nocardia brasiliensis]
MAVIDLSDVGETALWNLYSRADEARRPGGVLEDPACVRVFEAIEYDYAGKFGKKHNGLHAEKSRIFDTVVRGWLADHPGGTVVELGTGLETQFQRVGNGTVSWICVDLPEVIAVREEFLPPAERQTYIAADARDLSWFDQVGAGPVLVTAQGLFMFFQEKQVRQLVVAIVDRFPNVELVFDTISPMMSEKSVQGYDLTENCRLPAMPWGIKPNDVEPLLRRWHVCIADVEVQRFGAIHGALNLVKPLFAAIPGLRDILPIVVRVKTSNA